MERDDVQLIRSILSGNDEAFSTLVHKYKKGVHALAWRKIGDFHHAEEITQDTFLQVYKKLPTLKNPNQFAGWLYVIANRLCLNWMRKKKLRCNLWRAHPWQKQTDSPIPIMYQSSVRQKPSNIGVKSSKNF
ncbi:MAG: hypothetical protein OXU51_15220 [Candidatus Poribacteria bacterium]|nr:hypothetical protein [Candidatus Poribacteria bacterium]